MEELSISHCNGEIITPRGSAALSMMSKLSAQIDELHYRVQIHISDHGGAIITTFCLICIVALLKEAQTKFKHMGSPYHRELIE